MKTTLTVIKLAVLGLLLVVGPSWANAGTANTYYTNYWVQPVNFTLTAYVQQTPDIVRSGSMPTKQFLTFLSGLTNPEIVLQTNYIVTTQVTNSPFLPTNPFPASFIVTNNYILTVGGVSFTNNSSFTNPISVTETSTNPVTYVFANSVEVASNVTAYVIPDFVSTQATAVLTTQGPGTVFALTGTNPAGTFVYGTNPNFAQQSGAKLISKTPVITIVGPPGTNAFTNTVTSTTNSFVVRYGSGKSQVETPVNTFIQQGPSRLSVSQTVGGVTTGELAFDEIDFDTLAGTYFKFVGFDNQNWGVVATKNKLGYAALAKQRKITASNFVGLITGQVQDLYFSAATAVVSGTITFGNGTMEAP